MKRIIICFVLVSVCLWKHCTMLVIKKNGINNNNENEIEVPKFNIHVEQNAMDAAKAKEINMKMKFNNELLVNMEIELEQDIARFQAVIMKQNELIKKMIDVSGKLSEILVNIAKKENIIL